MDFPEDLLRFVSGNRDALFGIVGVIVGGVITLLIDLIIGSRATRLKLREQLLNRRIESYGVLLDLSDEMSRSYDLPYPKSRPFSNVQIPKCFGSADRYSKFIDQFNLAFKHISWLSWDSSVYLRVVQVYFRHLNDFIFSVLEPVYALELDKENENDYLNSIKDLETSFLWEIGPIVLSDFVEFGELLEESAFRFYRWGLWRLQLSNPSSRHKWEARLQRKDSSARHVQDVLMSRTQLVKGRTHLEEIGAEYKVRARRLREKFSED